MLTIAGRNRIVLPHIFVGEVYLCSGQSNMEWPLSLVVNAGKRIRKPQIHCCICI